MELSTTAYRRISRQPRTIFVFSRVMVLGALIAVSLSFVLTVDIVARAPALVVPINTTRPIVAVIDGIVDKFHVVESQPVSVDDLIVTLDEPSLSLERTKLERELDDLIFERLVVSGLLYKAPLSKLSEGIYAASVADTEKQKWISFLEAQISRHQTTIEEFDAREEQISAAINSNDKSIEIVDSLFDLYKDRNSRIFSLIERGFQAKSAGVDSLINLRELEERLHTARSTRRNNLLELQNIKKQRAGYISKYFDNLSTRLVEIERSVLKTKTRLKTLSEQITQLEIRAPIDGIVQELNIAALQQRAGTKTLLNLVPVQNGLQLVARIKNQDIGHIKPGQSATLLFDAFPLAVYGTSSAIVKTISEDVGGISDTIPIPSEVVDKRIYSVEQMATQTGLSYIATLDIEIDDASKIEMRPGLSVLANIKIGEQRIISFLLNPLLRAWHSSLKEPV